MHLNKIETSYFPQGGKPIKKLTLKMYYNYCPAI